MREILFRGKRAYNGEWVEGFYVALQLVHYDRKEYLITDKDTGKSYEVDPATVGQYTGLKDKNGKRIFEGDIVRLEYAGKNRGVEGIAGVIFENGKFGVRWGWHKEFVCLDGFANTTLEVVGNIHDNQELLGGGEK